MDKERIEKLMCDFIDIVEDQMSGDLSVVDAKELGEIVDCAKDCAEIIKYCAEADYYWHVTDAMDKNTPERNMEEFRKRMYYHEPTLEEELEKIMNMTSNMSTENKTSAKQKIAQLAAKL